MTFRSRLAAACGTLAALLILLAAGIVFSPDRVQARASGQPLLPGLSLQKVAGIDISSGGTPVVSLRRTAAGWELPSGTRTYPASADRVTTFLRIVAGLTRTSLVSRSASHLSELGLSAGAAREVVLHQAGGPDVAVEVGARGPGGDADYVRVRGEQAVYLARGTASYFVSQEPSSWYELHVLPDDVQGTTVASISVSGSLALEDGAVGGAYTLRRASADKLDQWALDGSTAAVDRVTAGAMSAALANLEGLDFAAGGAAPDGSALHVTVTTFAGARYELEARRAAEPGRVLVTSSGSRWSWLVNPLALRRAVLPESRLLAK